jgi:hypothetical protein
MFLQGPIGDRGIEGIPGLRVIYRNSFVDSLRLHLLMMWLSVSSTRASQERLDFVVHLDQTVILWVWQYTGFFRDGGGGGGEGGGLVKLWSWFRVWRVWPFTKCVIMLLSHYVLSIYLHHIFECMVFPNPIKKLAISPATPHWQG